MAKKSKAADLFDDEKEEMVRMSLYVKASVQKRIQEIAEESGRPINRVVERILEKFLEG